MTPSKKNKTKKELKLSTVPSIDALCISRDNERIIDHIINKIIGSLVYVPEKTRDFSKPAKRTYTIADYHITSCTKHKQIKIDREDVIKTEYSPEFIHMRERKFYDTVLARILKKEDLKKKGKHLNVKLKDLVIEERPNRSDYFKKTHLSGGYITLIQYKNRVRDKNMILFIVPTKDDVFKLGPDISRLLRDDFNRDYNVNSDNPKETYTLKGRYKSKPMTIKVMSQDRYNEEKPLYRKLKNTE